MSKISEFIESLSEEELDVLEKDLKQGYLQKHIDRKKEFFKIKGKSCPVCEASVGADCFLLIWGEPTLRKKAHFCGKDCLQYFLNRSNIQKKSQKKYTKDDKNALKKAKTII